MRRTLLAGLLLAASAQAETVDRIVVVVDDRTTQIVMDSDVRLETELAEHDTTQLPFWRHGTATHRLVDAAIIRDRAGDLSLYQPQDDEVRGRIEMIRRSFEDRAHWNAFLQRWGMDASDLRQVVRDRMIVEAWLRRNIPLDPSDSSSWMKRVRKLLAAIRPTVTVREVPP